MKTRLDHKLRVHVFGASGSGTTTFGRALAAQLSIPHYDTDDFYWVPTDPSYQEKRPIPQRLALMETMFLSQPHWVLSGSLVSWSETLIPFFDVVIFISLENEERLARVKARETLRYGDAVLPGGERHEACKAFLEWNAFYEDPDFDGRSRAVHQRWMAGLDCPVLTLDSSVSVMTMVEDTVAQFKSLNLPAAI